MMISRNGLALILMAMTFLAMAPGDQAAPVAIDAQLGVIVQGADAEAVAAQVHSLGGSVTANLSNLRAVTAEVTPEQARQLRQTDGLRVFVDPWAGL